MEDCPSFTAVGSLGTLSALKDIRISGCAVLADLSGLAGCGARKLSLSDLPVLTDLDVLAHLPRLRTLEVYRCPLIRTLPAQQCRHVLLFELPWTDLSGLRAGPALRRIRLFSEKLTDIGALTALPGLTDVDIDFCTALKDWSPLLDIPALDRLKPPRYQMYEIEEDGGTDPVLDALAARGVTRYE
ncbi:hypothetical protein SUDANB145_07346 (plasmid) [Streptomyces sp. enrichment culture]|uniref:hypothetical protein n=1 Tax=Streptomyces sp. enrichment culture TaxID=1795815 RepID=UPI003F5743A8